MTAGFSHSDLLVMSKSNFFSASALSVRFIVGAVFVCAGVIKFASPDALASTLTELFGPSSLWLVAVYLVALVDLATGCLLVFATVGSLGVALLVLAVYSAFLAGLLMMSDPPECNCLGKLLQFASARDGILMSMGRNAALIGLIAAAFYAERHHSGAADSP